MENGPTSEERKGLGRQLATDDGRVALRLADDVGFPEK